MDVPPTRSHLAERIASRMLAQRGIADIWDTQVAAATVYGLGKLDAAVVLAEIAEAAEQLWLTERSRFCRDKDGELTR